MKFKLGDKVRIKYNDKGSGEYEGEIGVIYSLQGTGKDPFRYPYKIEGISNNWGEHELELVENKPKQTIMTKLSNAVKKFLSADLQAQIKAGFRFESNLELTEVGKCAAIEALLDATPAAQAAFTATANEIVAEQEKNK